MKLLALALGFGQAFLQPSQPLGSETECRSFFFLSLFLTHSFSNSVKQISKSFKKSTNVYTLGFGDPSMFFKLTSEKISAGLCVQAQS